jgi:hypothetical protein
MSDHGPVRNAVRRSFVVVAKSRKVHSANEKITLTSLASNFPLTLNALLYAVIEILTPKKRSAIERFDL